LSEAGLKIKFDAYDDPPTFAFFLPYLCLDHMGSLAQKQRQRVIVFV